MFRSFSIALLALIIAGQSAFGNWLYVGPPFNRQSSYIEATGFAKGSSSAYVDLGSAAGWGIEYNVPFSVIIHTKFNALNNPARWFGASDGSPTFRAFTIQGENTTVDWLIRSNFATTNQRLLQYNSAVTTGVANCWVGTSDGAGGMKLYKDRTLLTPNTDSGTISGTIIPTTNAAIGLNLANSAWPADGTIAQVAVWVGVALSQSEVNAVCPSTGTGYADVAATEGAYLKFRWSFDRTATPADTTSTIYNRGSYSGANGTCVSCASGNFVAAP
jgi:hypothetical protein